jgi:hypothetical protein
MSDIVAAIIDGKHTRANVRAIIASLEDHHVRGVPIPPKLAAALPAVCGNLMQSDSPRVVAAGAKLVLACLKHNLEVHQHADKMARLDTGQATERVDVKLYDIATPTDAV